MTDTVTGTDGRASVRTAAAALPVQGGALLGPETKDVDLAGATP